MNERSLCAFVAALASSGVFAGTIYDFELKEPGEDPPRAGTIRMITEDQAVRMEHSYADGREAGGMIFLGDRGEMIALDHASKEYHVMDETAMRRMASDVGSAMEQAMKGMSAEQRAMLEQVMKDSMPQAVSAEPATLHDTGDADSVSGYDCRRYEIRQEGTKVRELCVAGWNEVDGGREASGAMMRMGAFFEEMARELSAAVGIDVLGDQRDFFTHLEEVDGYPVLVREFGEDGELVSEMKLTSARSADVDPGSFEPPAGYREASPGM